MGSATVLHLVVASILHLLLASALRLFPAMVLRLLSFVSLATFSHLGEVLVLCFMSAGRVRLCLELRGVTRCNVRFLTRVLLSAFPYRFKGYVQRKRALTLCNCVSCESVKDCSMIFRRTC